MINEALNFTERRDAYAKAVELTTATNLVWAVEWDASVARWRVVLISVQLHHITSKGN